MIKIIRHGENPPYRRAECPHCGCIFEYQKSDMRMVRNGDSFEMHIIQCPQCGKNIRVSEWDNEANAESASLSDLRAIKELCDKHSEYCGECPLSDECARMFSSMAPSIWQDSDIEAFEKEINE